MKKEWVCKKCGLGHDPQGSYSLWKCNGCGALRWPGVIWGGGGLLVVLLFVGLWALIPSENPEEKFLAQVRTFLKGDAKTEGEITPDKTEKLKILATQLKLSNQMDELIKKGKQEYLQAKREALRKTLNLQTGQEIPSKDLQPLCILARKMDMVTAVQGCSVPTEDITALLAQGEFTKARELCRSVADDTQGRRLCTEIETPLTADASLQYQMDGKEASAIIPVDATELSGLTLTNKDNYRLMFSVSQDDVFFYVFQKDHYGEIKRLFPDPVWSRGVDNPVQKSKRYQIPGEREWLYLDELPAAQSDPIAEYLYIIASPWRAKDIEHAYGKIHEATTPDVRKELVEKFMQQLQVRKDPSFKCLFYKEFLFKHGK